MKYSFLIPTYNSDRWIQPCINSILAQTYTGFNIIIVDSGSTDGTLKWIREIGDSRIRIYTTNTRLGIVENWQRFTTIPRNEFMTIMGHDDILYPNYLATIDQLIEQNPDAGLYQTHFNFIDGKGKIIRAGAPMKMRVTPEEFLEAVLLNTMEITATGFMVRSKHYDNLGGIPAYPNLLYADIELWLNLVMNSYLAVAPENCFEFRLHVDNTSKSTGEFRLIAFERLVDYFCKLKDKFPAFQQLIEKDGGAFLKNYVVGSCHKLIYIPKSNRNHVTMNKIIASGKRCAEKLIPTADFKPEKFPGILLAKLIDSNIVLRSLFLYYKSFQKRTF
jgi:glycosyltransferase involved in cell wall biosynthesis